MSPVGRDRLPVGADQAPLSEAHLPRASARRSSSRSSSWWRSTSGRPAQRRRLRVRVVPDAQRAGGAAGDHAVRGGVAVPADHGAGRRRHLRLRGPQRHAEDDPHALARARADLRRQGVRGRHLRGRRDPARRRPWRWSPGSIQSGFNSLQTLSGTIVSAPKALELVYVGLLVYLIPIATVVAIGLLLSTDHPQQRRGGRRHADGLAAVPADRDPAGARRRLQPYLLSTQFNAWQGLLRDADRLGAGGAGRMGVRDVRRARAGAAFLVFLRRDVAGG